MKAWLVLLKVIGVALQYALPYFLGKQKAELEHEREQKEAVTDLAKRLGNRAVDDADAVRRLRAKAKKRRDAANDP